MRIKIFHEIRDASRSVLVGLLMISPTLYAEAGTQISILALQRQACPKSWMEVEVDTNSHFPSAIISRIWKFAPETLGLDDSDIRVDPQNPLLRYITSRKGEHFVWSVTSPKTTFAWTFKTYLGLPTEKILRLRPPSGRESLGKTVGLSLSADAKSAVELTTGGAVIFYKRGRKNIFEATHVLEGKTKSISIADDFKSAILLNDKGIEKVSFEDGRRLLLVNLGKAEKASGIIVSEDFKTATVQSAIGEIQKINLETGKVLNESVLVLISDGDTGDALGRELLKSRKLAQDFWAEAAEHSVLARLPAPGTQLISISDDFKHAVFADSHGKTFKSDAIDHVPTDAELQALRASIAETKRKLEDSQKILAEARKAMDEDPIVAQIKTSKDMSAAVLLNRDGTVNVGDLNRGKNLKIKRTSDAKVLSVELVESPNGDRGSRIARLITADGVEDYLFSEVHN